MEHSGCATWSWPRHIARVHRDVESEIEPWGLFSQPLFNETVCVCVCVFVFSHVQLFATPWTTAHQAPLSMGLPCARILEWVTIPFSRGSSWPRDQTRVSYIGRRVPYHWATWEASMGFCSSYKGCGVITGEGKRCCHERQEAPRLSPTQIITSLSFLAGSGLRGSGKTQLLLCF